jgi:hypothetical protein
MSKEIPSVVCRSGLTGYQCKLQDSYDTYAQWEAYADTYGLHLKLGFASIREAWDANPIIQGSVIPADFCKIIDGERYFYDSMTGKLETEDEDEN